MMRSICIGIVAALLATLARPAWAQEQQEGNVERVETPQGVVTIVRPTPRAQPYIRGPQVNPDPVPPPPATPFLTEQTGSTRTLDPYGAPLPSPYFAPYAPYVVLSPPVAVIQRRGVGVRVPRP
jgi:hypothetical protein